jgi:hypothetical protein
MRAITGRRKLSVLPDPVPDVTTTFFGDSASWDNEVVKASAW